MRRRKAAGALGATQKRGEILLAACAFALSVPLGKRLLDDLPPLALAGGLYLAAGASMAIALLVSQFPIAGRPAVNLPRGGEWLWLAAAIAAGGVAAPLALFLGLRETPAHVAGLLLNFEVMFTIGLGMAFGGERLGRGGAVGAAAILAGAVLCSLPAGAREVASVTRLSATGLVVLACALWAVDNNLSRRVSLRDARVVVAIKGLAGGTVLLALASATGQLGAWSALRVAAVAALGTFSYGFSILLFVRGLRSLGVSLTAALFATAPGFAAVLSWMLLGEPVRPAGLAALGLMTFGGVLLATVRHRHLHVHAELVHEHEHEHDEHHRHAHTQEELATLPHAHLHGHEPLVHAHEHAHDVHHRHRHGRKEST